MRPSMSEAAGAAYMAVTHSNVSKINFFIRLFMVAFIDYVIRNFQGFRSDYSSCFQAKRVRLFVFSLSITYYALPISYTHNFLTFIFLVYRTGGQFWQCKTFAFVSYLSAFSHLMIKINYFFIFIILGDIYLVF